MNWKTVEDAMLGDEPVKTEEPVAQEIIKRRGRPKRDDSISSRKGDPVNSPAHYTDGGIETIDYIEAKQLNYHLGNVVKYVSRAGKKAAALQDLEKAKWYLDREIARLKGDQ